MKKQFWTYAPGPLLGHLVKCFWLYKTDNSLDLPLADRYIPDGQFEIILDLGDNFAQQNNDGSWVKAPSLFLAGGYTEHFFVKSGQSIYRLGAVIKRGMVQHVIREDLMHLKGRNTDLEDIWGDSIKSFGDHLRSLHSPMRIFKALETFLYNTIKFDTNDSTFEWVINEMVRYNGNSSVRSLAQKAHMSERQFRRKFREKIGLSPKQYMKIIRVASATQNIIKCKHQKLSDIAYEVGFADQSHLIREFKSIAGINPKAFISEPHPLTEQLILTL